VVIRVSPSKNGGLTSSFQPCQQKIFPDTLLGPKTSHGFSFSRINCSGRVLVLRTFNHSLL
jgi:hypothetical protein